jgi:hypothetical protein
MPNTTAIQTFPISVVSSTANTTPVYTYALSISAVDNGQEVQGTAITSYTFAGIGSSRQKYQVTGINIESVTLSGKTYRFRPRIKVE